MSMAKLITCLAVLIIFASVVFSYLFDRKTAENSNNFANFRLKIMSYNVFDLPTEAKYMEERVESIGQEIAKAEYDIYILEELWEIKCRKIIEAAVPDGYFITGVE